MKRKYQYALLYLFFPILFVGRALPATDLDQLLKETTKKVFAIQYGFSNSPLLNNWIKKIKEKLSHSAGINVELYLVDSEGINAYATFGNQVFVTKGLLKMVESEDELACVLAHEVAHIKLRHPQKQIGVIELSFLLLSSLDLKGKKEILARFVLALANLGFSRSQEKEADIEGIDIALKSGYNPRAMLSFFEREKGDKAPRWMEYLSTHPFPEKREKICEDKIRLIPQEQWEKIYHSLWERGEAKEARQLPQYQPQPPIPHRSPSNVDDQTPPEILEALRKIYYLSQDISRWQSSLLLTPLSYEFFPLISEAVALNERLKELYGLSLNLYRNVKFLNIKPKQTGFVKKSFVDFLSALNRMKKGAERLLLGSSSLTGLVFSRYTQDLSLVTLQSILLSSADEIAKAKNQIEYVNTSLLSFQIESIVQRLNELDNDWLRRKCSYRLGIPVEPDIPIGDFCLIACVSLTVDKCIGEVKRVWEEISGIEQFFSAYNVKDKDREAIYIFLNSLLKGN